MTKQVRMTKKLRKVLELLNKEQPPLADAMETLFDIFPNLEEEQLEDLLMEFTSI